MQEAEIRRIAVQSQPRQIVPQTLSQKHLIGKKGLVEWLKVYALSLSPSTAREKKERSTQKRWWVEISTRLHLKCTADPPKVRF
jgi:hypothetical protein